MMFPPCDCAAIDVTMSIHTTTISVDKVNHVISQETESVLESEGHRTPQKAVWREWASQPSSSTRAKNSAEALAPKILRSPTDSERQNGRNRPGRAGLGTAFTLTLEVCAQQT